MQNTQEYSEEMQPTIRLEIFRHDEKDQAEHDHIAPLTQKGKRNALSVGRSKRPDLNQGHVLSSPRERALHSAILQFFGPQFEGLNLHSFSLEELLKKLKAEKIKLKSGKTMRVGNKIKTDERLNFHVESHAEFNEKFYQEYNKKEDNRTLDFQLYKSDQLIVDLAKRARENNYPEVEGVIKIKGFLRMVGDLAEVIQDYFRKFPFWKKSYRQHVSNYHSSEMQVFIGTHSQNIECFLMKIIQMKRGIGGLEDFLKSLPHRKSFIQYSEGFSLVIKEKEGCLVAILQCKDYQFILKKEDFEQMIRERDTFNKLVEKKIKEPPDS